MRITRTLISAGTERKHAEMVAVPVNLCAPIPDTVSDEAAAFTVIGAIALQCWKLARDESILH